MPATNKVGTQLLVSPHIRARAQALALVRQESVAEVWRYAIEGGGLATMERDHWGSLRDLEAVLNSIGGDHVELLDTITRMKLRYGDLFDAKGEPMTRLPLRKVS